MRVLITGGANGIGRATVEQLLKEGREVTVIDNDAEALEKLPDEADKNCVDVRDEIGVPIDDDLEVLINCAGYQKQGSVEDMELEEFRTHIETNYLGTVRMVKEVLPVLKENSGRIINVSSMAGFTTIPFLGAYSASKYAVEGFSDSLRMELEDTGIDVVVVEPGPVKTGFNQRGVENLEKYLPGSGYSEKYRYKLEEEGLNGVSPEKAAETILKAVESPDPEPRYRITWQSKLAARLKPFLPTSVYDRLARKI